VDVGGRYWHDCSSLQSYECLNLICELVPFCLDCFLVVVHLFHVKPKVVGGMRVTSCDPRLDLMVGLVMYIPDVRLG
jgi:hypothetical protein